MGTKIIAFGGYKSSGKSEATRYLVSNGYTELKMADPLKDMLRTLYSYSDYSLDMIEERLEGSLKEIEDPFLGVSPRLAMQTLGTEWRNMLNTRLWSNIWLLRAREMGRLDRNVVSSDVRFLHEIEALRSVGGKFVWISRPGTSSDGHDSEQDMSRYADYGINNEYDINYLRSEVTKIVRSI